MKPFTTLALCAGAFGLLPAALYLGDRMLSSQQTPAMRRLTFADALKQMRRHEQLEADRAVLLPLVAEKEKILAELIAGHRSLRSAANALREEYESRPPHLCFQDDRPPEQSLEEYFVRRTLERVEDALRNDPRRDAILARLHGELQDYLCEKAAAPP